jgi:hypothetical protein
MGFLVDKPTAIQPHMSADYSTIQLFVKPNLWALLDEWRETRGGVKEC